MVKTLWEKEQEERERKRLKDAARLQSFLTNKPANKTAGQAQPTAKAAINAQPRIYDSSVKQASPQYYKRDNVQEDAISRQAERLQAKAADLDWQRTRGGLSPAKQQELGRKQRLAQVAYDNFQDNNSQAAWLKTIRDVGSIQADIDRIQAQRYKLSEQRAAQAAGQERTRAYSPNSGIGGMQKSTEDQISALAKQLDLLKDERDVARYVQYFVDIPNRQDFVSRSAPRVNFGNDDPTYRQINGLAIPDWRVTSDPMAAAQAMEGFDTQWAQANRENSQMTDEERKIYNYLYAEAGSAAAEEFLDYIRDPLNRRLAEEMAQAYAGNGVFGRIEQGLDAALAGGEQFFTGIGNSFRSEPTSPSARQYAYQFGREDASAGGRLALDALYTAGNMAPGILLSTVAGGIAGAAGATAGTAATIGSAAGNTAMGLSAAGNAYAEKIRAGYDEGEARSYSILVGASEALLQRLLGGISSLGGKAGDVARRIDAIDGAFWRASGQLGLSMAKEGSEEALQAILEPLFAKLILDEDASPEVVGEIAYSYLMGALMGGIFDAGPAIRRGLNPEPVALTGGIGARRPVGLMGGVGEQRPILGEQPYLPNADFLPGERTRSQQGEVPGVDISDLFRAQSGGSVYQPGPQADDSINLDMAEQGDSGARQDDLLEALLGLREEQRQRQQQVSDGDWEDEDAIWGDILYVPGQLINTELEGEFPDASLQRLFDDSDDAAIQSEVDAYVDHAIAKSKYVENPLITNEDLDNLLIGAVSPELAEEIWRFYGVDISNKTHVLNDNDLRHIYNHHGPHTNEKYPVTKKDLKAIPKIIKNYGDVYYIPRDDGKTGIVYLYRHNGVTYYLEQIADGNILSNKQMIKVPTGKIPDIPGIEEAIKKKQSLAPDAAGNAAQKAANAGPRMYVPDVKDSVSAASIAKPEAAVKGNELLEALLPDYARGPENSRKTQNVLRPDREVKLADPFMDIWLPETVEMLGLDLAGIKRDKKTLREMRKQYEIEAGLTPESIFFAGQYGNVSNKPGDYRLGQAPPSGISGLLYPARRDRRRQAIKAQRETAAAVLVPALEYDQRSLIAAANANKDDAPQQQKAMSAEEAAQNQSMLEALLGKELDPQGTGKAEQYFTDALRAANRNLGAQENAALEPGGVRYKFVGTRSDGIEVYETSEEVSNLSKKQRQEAFLLLMQKDYLGRTAKFTTRSGQTYYAKFDETDIRKNIYGDKKSDRLGYNAKVNTGADGNIFELVENAKHDGGKPETGKKIAAHRNVGDWDYFVKTVQIDGKVYDLLANVRKKSDGEYVYSIQLTENKNKASAPPSRQTSGYVSVAGHLQTRVGANASNQSLTDNTTKSQYQSSGALDSSLSDTRSSRPDLRESALAAWNSAAAPETQAETARGPETAPGTPSPETEEAVNEGEKDPTELDNYREMVAEIEAGDAAYGRLKISETTAKALTDKGVSGFKDIDRNIEAALKGTEDAPEVAAEIKEKIIDPLFSAKGARAAAVRKNLKRVKSIVGETGVKKGSRESAAAQWYGEGFRTDEYGKRHAYGEVDLRREFPEKAEKIMACAQQLRAMYDEYIDRINAVLERIYPDPVGYAQREVERLQANARYYEGQARIMQEAGNADGAAQMKGEAESFWKRAARKQKDIDSGDVLRNKRLQKRQDYFHHFQEMSDGLGGLKNILSAPHEIDPRLVGKSEGTKPKSRWAGFMQRRGEGPYQADAIGGMLEYILAAEHKIAFDPVIADLRSITCSIAEATKKTRNCNGLIQWLTDFANDLAGKTNPFVDRLLIRSTNGRKWMKFFQWLNRRVRANQVTLNPRSAIAQFFNIQNAWNNMADARDWIRGATLYARSLMKDSPERQLLEKSGFLSERWLDRELRGFDDGIAADINNFSSWMMESGDKISTEMIWCVALAKGQREGIKGTDALVDYADHLTLKSVGGRGVGEAPLNMKAEFTKTIFPFQLEVNNQWQNMKENLRSGDAKAIGRMIASSVVGYLMNEPLRQLFGFDVGFDPINALLEGLEAWNDEEDEDKTASSFLQDVGGRFAGEIIGAAPGGAQILSMILPDDDVRESIFGEGDPTRYGTGNLGLNILTEPVAMAIQGKDFSDELLSSMLGILPPIGGRQAERIIQGVKNATGFEPELSSSGGFKMKDQAPGASYTVNGNLRFPIHNDPGNLLMSMLFGPYSTREGKQYIEDGSKALSQKETAFYNAAVRGGMEGQEALELIQATKDDLSPWQLEKVLAESSDPDMAASFILQRNEKTWAMAQRLNRPGMSHVGYAEYAAFRAHTQGGNREQVMSYLRNSDLYMEQKEALYSTAAGFSGDYGNWERAYEELVGKNAAFSALNLTEQKKVLEQCLHYEPGTEENSKAEAALLAGWTLGEYYTMKASVGNIRADKDKDGESISGSRKKKVLEYLDESSLSLGQQGVYLLLTENWKLSNEMIRAAGKYILSLNCTEEQRAELADLCSFVVNPDGTLTYERRK